MGNWLNKSGLTQIRNILSDKFATKVDNHPSNVPEGKFLQTNENGYAVWGDAASPAAVAQAAEDWMDQHISGDLTLGLDSSLRLDGYAAESSAAGDIVMCTNTRPDPQDPTDHPSNKLWINNAQQTEYEIPEMSDLDDLKSAFDATEDSFLNMKTYRPALTFTNGLISSSNGNISANGYYQYSQMIPVKQGLSFKFVSNSSSGVLVIAMYANKDDSTAIVAKSIKGNSTLSIRSGEIPEGINYIRFSQLISESASEYIEFYPFSYEQIDKNISDIENVTEAYGNTVSELIGKNYISPFLQKNYGYIAKSNGQIVVSTNYTYSQMIPVNENQQIEYVSGASSSVFAVAMYASESSDSADTTKSIPGTNDSTGVIKHATIPNGISFIRFCYNNLLSFNQYIRFMNSSSSEERYITDGFDILSGLVPVVGGYYASGTTLVFNNTGGFANYKCYSTKASQGHYTVIGATQFAVGTDDSDVVTYYSGNTQKVNFDLPEGTTKLYVTFNPTNYPDGIKIVKGYELLSEEKRETYNWLQPNFVPKTIMGQSIANRVYCSIPSKVYMNTSDSMKIYLNDILAQADSYFWCNSVTGLTTYMTDEYLQVTCGMAGNYTMNWAVYDSNLQLIDNGETVFVVSDLSNLENATALILGDSFVAYGGYSSRLREQYTENGKTVTLIGTRGTAPNLHEGRGGWTAKSYCTMSSLGQFTNPFYHNNSFDFAYYMQQNGYSAPDYVVINLGINAIYALTFGNYKQNADSEIVYYKQIIDSIHEYNSSIKIYCCLPTPPNTQNGKFSEAYGTAQMLWMYANNIKHYAHDLGDALNNEENTIVVPTNCILDTNTDIGDGVHPATDGYPKLMSCVIDAIVGT